MKSMTGFAHHEVQSGRMSVGLELKSYNNRYLDVVVNLPSYLGPLEPRFRDFLSGGVERGRVECTLKVKEFEEDVRIVIDSAAARAYTGALEELIRATGIEDRVGLSHLLSLEGVLKLDRTRDLDAYWVVAEPLLRQVFLLFDESRLKEGAATQADIESQIELIERNLLVIETCAPNLETYIKENLRARFVEMMGQGVDENRIYAETAVMLVKYSINEEIVRFRSHLAAFREGVRREKSPGRKLDFICQEINREINTIGSKSFIIEVNQAVIEIKDALEKIREQLRNVE